MCDVIRIRLKRFPTARDLEYLALRYLKVEGVYDVPLPIANDLIQFGYAQTSDESEPLSEFTDALPHDCHDESE